MPSDVGFNLWTEGALGPHLYCSEPIIQAAARWEVVLHLQILSCFVKSGIQSGWVKISKEPDVQSCQDGISLGILNVMDTFVGKNVSTYF